MARVKVNVGKVLSDVRTMRRKLNNGKMRVVRGAAQIIQHDIKRGIDAGIDINGKPFKKLAPGTVHSKRAKGFAEPRKALVAKGTMRRLPPVRYTGKGGSTPSAMISVAKSRKEIGKFHQVGTVPHVIRAKKKHNRLGPMFGQRGDKSFATGSVQHPGNPVREWFGISKRAKVRINNMISKVLH